MTAAVKQDLPTAERAEDAPRWCARAFVGRARKSSVIPWGAVHPNSRLTAQRI